MRMLLIDVADPKVKIVDASTLEEYYRLLNCDTIDITIRKIAGEYFDIICDDEGLLKECPILSAIYEKSRKPALVGNLLITGGSCDGELLPITKEQYQKVRNKIAYCVNNELGKVWPMVELDDSDD